MKKIIAFVLALVMICPAFSVSAEEARSYGADNLNNEPGELIIGFIGGSITEGSGATYLDKRYSTLLVEEYFKKNYPEKTVIERNAAIGGTTSAFGHIRIKGDLLSGENTPDVVFIEFACNDYTTNESAKESLSMNMESMVRQLLELPKIPVIIFFYTTKTTSAEDPTRTPALDIPISAHSRVAKHYGIYEIDVNDYIWNGVEEGKWIWNPYEGSKIPFISNDNAHPTDFGYKLYADYIAEQLDADKENAFKKLDPETEPCCDYVYGNLEEVHLSDERVKMSDGWEFAETYPEQANWNKTGDWPNKFFPGGFYYTERCKDKTVELEFTGRGAGFQFNRTRDGGIAKWEVFDESGASVASGETATYYKTDAGRPGGSMVCRDLPFGKYRMVITGAINRTPYEDYKESDGAYGGTGTYLGLQCFMVETTAPEGADPNEIKVVLGGEKIKFDVKPQIINDRTMVPLRAIFEALGAEVSWDDATKTVTAVKGDVTIKMTIGAESFLKNEESVSLDSPATIVDSRTLVPVRAIAESFGSTVGWNGETKTVTIED